MSATVKIIPTKSTSALIEYVGRVDVSTDPKTERARVMFASGQHCRPQTAAREFRALRVEYGRQDEMRTLPGRYVHDKDAEPTHLKAGKNWRKAKSGEKATHTRIEPEVPVERCSEGYHYIVSFAPDTVNRDDPEQCHKAFEAVEAMWAQDYPGTQATLTAHGDAKGSQDALERGEEGKFHVHIAANAIIHSEMEVDGRIYRPGQRMAGALTNVDTIRDRWDQFLETRGHEFGLEPQNREILPAIGSEEYRNKPRRTNQDFWENERGKISDHDRARRGLETAFAALAQDPAAMAKLDANERMQRLLDEAAGTNDLELKLRTQKSDGQLNVRSYVVPDRTQAIGHTKLGDRYTHDGVTRQLELIAQGQWKPYERAHSGPVKPIAELGAAEVRQLQATVDELAAREVTDKKLDTWLDDRASENDQSVDELWAEHQLAGSSADRKFAKKWMSDWEDAQAKARGDEVSQGRIDAAVADPQMLGAILKHHKAQSEGVDAQLAAISEITKQHGDKRGLQYLVAADLYSAQEVATAAHQVTARYGNGWQQMSPGQMLDARFAQLFDEQQVKSASILERASQPNAAVESARVVMPAEQDRDPAPADQPATQPQAPAVAKPKKAEEVAADIPSVQQEQKVSKPQPVEPSRAGGHRTASDRAQTNTLKVPHRTQDVGRLTPRQMQDRELIAVVRSERADGGAYVSFELAAHDPVATGRKGLYLHAKETKQKDKQGNTRALTNTWQQLTKAEYGKLQLVADENGTKVDGRQVYGVRGDVRPWGQGGQGYDSAVDSLAASRRPRIGQDVLQKQRESESIARKAELHKLIGKVGGQSIDSGEKSVPTPQEKAFAAEKQREQNRSHDGLEF